MANLANARWCKKPDWNPGTWVFIWEYSGLRWFSKIFASLCVESHISGLSTGRVRIILSVAGHFIEDEWFSKWLTPTNLYSNHFSIFRIPRWRRHRSNSAKWIRKEWKVYQVFSHQKPKNSICDSLESFCKPIFYNCNHALDAISITSGCILTAFQVNF